MDIDTKDQTETREELWLAWVRKGKRSDLAIAWKLKVVAGVSLGILASAIAIRVVVGT